MAAESESLITLDAVGFSYDGTHWVLKEISLVVRRGERVVILGRNGSGKSTLVRILGALRSPSQGACFVRGRDTAPASGAEVRRKVGVVFQNPESQIVAAVVEDDVAFAPENQGLNPAEIERRIASALAKVGLSHKRSCSVSALSGGEKQRLALAGALAAEPVCLILDEVSAMLDPEGRAQVENVLRGLHASGVALIQVTHRLEDILHADRVLVLADGNWLWQGRPEDFWSRAEALGFEPPPLFHLAARLRVAGASISIPSVEEVTRALASRARAARIPPVPAEDAAPGGAYLAVRDLHYRFNPKTPLEVWALKNVSCSVPEGKWTAVLGRTGSGKSTLMQHLNGLHKIQSGSVTLRGVPVPQAGEGLRGLRRSVGMVFQAPEDQLFSPTVGEELAFAPKNWGFSKEDTEKNVRAALESVGLKDADLERNPLNLSGGERRLVAVASVLSADPDCLVLDEPTAGLDTRYRKRIIALLARLRARGKTVITVTHDLDMAFAFCDHFVVLKDGVRVCEGSAREILPDFLALEPRSAWPEILQVSEALNRDDPRVPLTWDLDLLSRAFGL